MPTYYEPDTELSSPERPVFRVTLPTGQRVPMMASEDQLRAAGAMPVIDEGPDERLALGRADAMRTRSNPPPEKPDASSPWQRADSPEFQARLDENERRAKAQDVARPNVDTSTRSTGEDVGGASGVLDLSGRRPPSLDEEAAAYRAANTRYVAPRPAGFVPRGVTQVTEGAVSPERQEGIAEADDAYIAATKAVGAAEAAKAADQAMALQQQAEERAAVLEGMRQRKAEVDSEVQRRMTEVDQRLQEVKDTPAPKAANLFSAGPLGALLGSIGLFLGSLGQRHRGEGPNYGYEGIKDAIDRDLQNQRAKLAKKGQELGDAKNALSEYVQIHGDPDTAEKELRLAQLEYARARGDAMAAKTNNKIVQANWAREAAKLEADKQRTLSELEARTRGRVQATYAYDPGSPGGAVGPSMSEARKAVIAGKKQQREYAEAQGYDPKLYVAGINGYALTEDSRQEMQNIGIARKNWKAALAKMREVSQQHAEGRLPRSKAGAEFEAAKADALLSIKGIGKTGALDEGMIKSVGGPMLGSLTLTSDNPLDRINETDRLVDTKLESELVERGVRFGPPPSNMATPVGTPLGVEKRETGERGRQ